MRRRLAAFAALGLVLATSGLADAATRRPAPRLPRSQPLVWTDQAGDADVISTLENDQLPDQTSQPAPVDRADADIRSVRIERVDDGRRVSGLKVSLTVASAPLTQIAYVVVAGNGACTLTFTYGSAVIPSTASKWGGEVKQQCGVTVSTIPVRADVLGSTVVWSIQLSDLKAPFRSGASLTSATAETRQNAPQGLFPTFDRASTRGSYVLGH